jgi:heat shock protein 4
LYDEGEDTTKAVYVAKIEELRSVAGIIIQRYLDKLEEERQERLRKEEEAAAKKRAAAEEAAKKKAEAEPKAAEDTEMKDAGPEVEEPDA